MSSPQSLKDQCKSLPSSPGVYMMKNRRGEVIYVGKAKNLKYRVRHYFQSSATEGLKTRKLVSQIHSFDVTMVATEVEALLLERSLVRLYRPKFNVLLRDDKSFPYIKADMQSPWPRITIVRSRNPHDGATYIGPYSNQRLMFHSLNWVHKIFPLVRCSPYEFSHAKRPCNYYGMKLCPAPCHKKVCPDSYKKMVREALDVLRGNHQSLRDDLTTKMLDASEQEDYEKAALYRDQLSALEGLNQQDKSTYKQIAEADIISLWHQEHQASFYVLHLRNHIISEARDFVVSRPTYQSLESLLEQFLLQFYDRSPPPVKIILPLPLANSGAISDALAHRKLHLPNSKPSEKSNVTEGYTIAPPKLMSPRGTEEKKLMETALKNAQFALLNHRKLHHTNDGELERVSTELGLTLNKVECIDISHLAGSAMVASLVRFVGGMPDKSGYRKFNIPPLQPQSQNHNDDYEAIRQIMTRRLAHEDLPDLIVIDGGKGQLSSATKVTKELLAGKPAPKILAIAKARSRDTAATTSAFDRLFLGNGKAPIPLTPGSPSHRFFSHLRDEAHRFAITHHRKRFRKIRHNSQLEQVKGIGKVTRHNLLMTFGSLEHLQNASIEEICAVKGMNLHKAYALKDHLKSLGI